MISLKQAAKVPFLQQPLHIAYCLFFTAFLVYTGLTTPDPGNWATENILTVSLVIFLIAFYNIFRFSDASYTLILLFLMLHMYGSQYQYASNPLGEWLQQTYNLNRNPYDRLVHLGFGLLLTYPIHEVLAAGFKLPNLWTYILPVELTLSLSAVYELAEWMVADWVYKGGQAGMDFLGMQGDIWDAQKDVALAVAGSITALLITFLLRRNKAR